jgi:hypothetical protein
VKAIATHDTISISPSGECFINISQKPQQNTAKLDNKPMARLKRLTSLDFATFLLEKFMSV